MLAEWLIEQGPFERRSDLGRFFKDPDTTHLPPQPPQLGVKNYSAAYSDPNPIQALLNSTRATGGFGEFEREALIRNACGLLTLRGQTFTVILRADAFAPRFGMTGVKQGNVLATATAVAQIWRDTEPMITEARNPVNNKLEKTYNYPTFIQFFKILNE